MITKAEEPRKKQSAAHYEGSCFAGNFYLRQVSCLITAKASLADYSARMSTSGSSVSTGLMMEAISDEMDPWRWVAVESALLTFSPNYLFFFTKRQSDSVDKGRERSAELTHVHKCNQKRLCPVDLVHGLRCACSGSRLQFYSSGQLVLALGQIGRPTRKSLEPRLKVTQIKRKKYYIAAGLHSSIAVIDPIRRESDYFGQITRRSKMCGEQLIYKRFTSARDGCKIIIPTTW